MAAVHPSDERTPLQPSLKLATSSSEPSPLQRTPTSDYLVLSRVDSYNQDIQLPRPQHWYNLTLFGVLDAAYTISAAATFGVQGKNEILMVVLGLCRALVVMLSTSHRRVREVGWMIVGSALVRQHSGCYSFPRPITTGSTANTCLCCSFVGIRPCSSCRTQLDHPTQSFHIDYTSYTRSILLLPCLLWSTPLGSLRRHSRDQQGP